MSKINTITVDNVSYDVEDTSKLLQVSTMLTASAETVGKIVQYVGTTTVEAPVYVNGCFYIGVTDGEETPTYSWQLKPTVDTSAFEQTSNKVTSLSQSSTDIEYPSAKCVWDLLSNLGDFSLDDIHFITPSTMNSGENKIVDLWTLDEGIYLAKNYRSQWAFYVRNGGSTTTDNTTFLFMIYKNKVNNVQTSKDLAYVATMSSTGAIGFKKLYFNVTGGNYIAITDMTSVTDMNPRFINSSAQTLKGEKTFNSIPKVSSYTAPTTDTELTAKKYVDDQVATKTIQYSTMPTADSTTVGKIVQYTGTTDNTYTNGYFYVGVTDGEDPATYSWEQLEVQPSASGGTNIFKLPGTGSGTSGFDFKTAQQGLYVSTYPTSEFYVKSSSTYSSNTYIIPLYLYIYDDWQKYVDLEYDSLTFATLVGVNTSDKCLYKKDFKVDKNGSITGNTTGVVTDAYFLTSGNQNISGVKTFSSIPQVSSYTAPTTDVQFTPKKYVDDQDKILLSNLAPTYDATSTYAVGDYVIYNNLLYVCNTSIPVAESWESTHWTRTTVAEIIKSLNVVTLSSQDQSNLQDILGSEEPIISDMTEEEAIEATNEIIGGNE